MISQACKYLSYKKKLNKYKYINKAEDKKIKIKIKIKMK